MSREKSLYYIVAPNPDGRTKGLLIVSCDEKDVQNEIIDQDLDIESVCVIAGRRLPVRQETRILLGEPLKRRGRPPGSKNKAKRAKKVAAKAKGKSKDKKIAAKAAHIAELSETAVKNKRGKKSGETQADRNARVEAGT